MVDKGPEILYFGAATFATDRCCPPATGTKGGPCPQGVSAGLRHGAHGRDGAKRDAAREETARGDDPFARKRRERIAAKIAIGTPFGDVALECIEKVEREGKLPATIAELQGAWGWLLPAIKQRPLDQVEPHELLAVLRTRERKGQLETARRTRAFAGRVFRYAVATARAKADPASLLLGAVAAPRPTNLAAIIEPKEVGALLRAIEACGGRPVTRCRPTFSSDLASCGRRSGPRSTSRPQSGASRPRA